jgi:hypothetical protein
MGRGVGRRPRESNGAARVHGVMVMGFETGVSGVRPKTARTTTAEAGRGRSGPVRLREGGKEEEGGAGIEAGGPGSMCVCVCVCVCVCGVCV